MNTDPFADLQDSDVKQAAYAVQARMSVWIDSHVQSLKAEMAAKATLAAAQVTQEVQSKFEQVLRTADTQLAAIESNLSTLTVGFTDPGLKEQSERLQLAIQAHKLAIREQKEKIRQYGQMVGSAVQAAVKMAV